MQSTTALVGRKVRCSYCAVNYRNNHSMFRLAHQPHIASLLYLTQPIKWRVLVCDETQNHILDAIFSPTSTKIADVIFVNKFYGRSF